MKTYRVTVNGRTYEIQIEAGHTLSAGASPIRVFVDGEPFLVTLEEISASQAPAVSKVEKVEMKGPATVQNPVHPAASSTNERAVTAPMPGTIMDIRVVAGQHVQRGEELCCLEAMKMKNSIKSPRQGTIAQVAVSEGQTVAYGDLLFLFE